MDGSEIAMDCPLCCKKKFNSKNALLQHLKTYSNSIKCSVCTKIFSSLPLLIEHLSVDDCICPQTNHLDPTFSQSSLQILTTDGNDHTYTDNLDNNPLKIENTLDNFKNVDAGPPSEIVLSDLQNDESSEPMYEFFNKPLSVEDEELSEDKNAMAEVNSDFLVVPHNDSSVLMEDGAILTRNSDGTVSIATSKSKEAPKKDPEPVITMNEKDAASDSEEVYNCNSCGISFTSVLDHVQTYHKNQDVIVEVNEQDQDTDVEKELDGIQVFMPPKEDSTETEPVEFVNVQESKRTPTKRVITDAGHIVESDVFTENQSKGKVSKALFHQVVMKEMVTIDSGLKVTVFYCTACHTYVTDLAEFKSHPCKVLNFSCKFCPASFETAKCLRIHFKTHKGKKESGSLQLDVGKPVNITVGPFRCDVCNTDFATNKSLKLHKRMHDPLKYRPIDPPVDQRDLDGQPNGANYFCGLCKKIIPVGYRTVHLEFHKNKESINCDICNKKFISNEDLEMHMNVHRTDKVPEEKTSGVGRPYSCLYCDRKFSRPHEKVKHERIHTGEKPHSCEICGKSFRVAYCLTLHMRSHTGARPYTCQHCGKRFKSHSVYNHHLLTHSDVRAYKCPFCPKAFKTSVQLSGHKKSHTKPFSCTDCNRPFSSLYAVRVHTETHKRQNNLKYACTWCGATYARTFALKDHIKQAHNAEVVIDSNCEKPVWNVFTATEQNKDSDILEDATILTDGADEEMT